MIVIPQSCAMKWDWVFLIISSLSFTYFVLSCHQSIESFVTVHILRKDIFRLLGPPPLLRKHIFSSGNQQILTFFPPPPSTSTSVYVIYEWSLGDLETAIFVLVTQIIIINWLPIYCFSHLKCTKLQMLW